MGGISSKVERKWSRRQRQPISKRSTLVDLLSENGVPGEQMARKLPTTNALHQAKVTIHQVELELSALALSGSSGNTLALVERRDEDQEEWYELGRTETILGKKSPHYLVTFVINIVNGNWPTLRFTCYDVDELDDDEGPVTNGKLHPIGAAEYSLHQLVLEGSQDNHNGSMLPLLPVSTPDAPVWRSMKGMNQSQRVARKRSDRGWKKWGHGWAKTLQRRLNMSVDLSVGHLNIQVFGVADESKQHPMPSVAHCVQNYSVESVEGAILRVLEECMEVPISMEVTAFLLLAPPVVCLFCARLHLRLSSN
jgi:hypothetical protein